MVFSRSTFGLYANKLCAKQGDCLPRLLTLALGVASLTALEVVTAASPAIAQPISALPICVAPGPEEYLLLVVLQTEAAQAKLAETLPPSVSAPTCNYLGSRVARMGGFQTPEDADAWASYLRDAAALPAFVAKPTQNSGGTSTVATTAPVAVNVAIQDPASLASGAQSTVQSPSQATSQTAPVTPTQAQRISPPLDVLPPPVIPTQPRVGNRVDVPQPGERAPAPASPPTRPDPSPIAAPPGAIAQAPIAPPPPRAAAASVKTYEPKGLADGYVVLVDYGNQTSLVPLLRQLTKQAVGLASYGQRPFLLVNYTPNSEAALMTLKTLSKSGFRTMLVDSEQVTLLTADVQVK